MKTLHYCSLVLIFLSSLSIESNFLINEFDVAADLRYINLTSQLSVKFIEDNHFLILTTKRNQEELISETKQNSIYDQINQKPKSQDEIKKLLLNRMKVEVFYADDSTPTTLEIVFTITRLFKTFSFTYRFALANEANQFTIQKYSLLKTYNQDAGSILSITKIDEDTFASPGKDLNIMIQNIKSEEKTELVGHKVDIIGLKYLGNSLLASGSIGGVKFWNIKTQKELTVFNPPLGSNSLMSVCEDFNFLTYGNDQNYIVFYSLIENSVKHYFKQKIDCFTCYAGDTVIYSFENIIYSYKISTREKKPLYSHPKQVTKIVNFEERIAFFRMDNTIIVWNYNTESIISTLSDQEPIDSIIFIDKDLIASSYLNKIKIWNVKSGEIIKTLIDKDDDSNEKIGDLAYLGNNKLAARTLSKIKIWGLDS